jgi:hypothetical protein
MMDIEKDSVEEFRWTEEKIELRAGRQLGHYWDHEISIIVTSIFWPDSVSTETLFK